MSVPGRFPHRIEVDWLLRSRKLSLGVKTRVMGIVNITPDSFSDGGLYLKPERAIDHALQLLEEGADVIDLGAESTRPGSVVAVAGGKGSNDSPSLTADQEQARLLPVLEGVLKARPDALISVDTYKSQTARAAVAAGAQIVNDVSGFVWDPEMAATCARLRCGVILMHARGIPSEWKTQAALAKDAVLPLVRDGLANSLKMARMAGTPDDAVVLDPGYGFGKRFDENYALLATQSDLLALGRPLLAGLSRKSFLTRSLSHRHEPDNSLEEHAAWIESRETASLAGQVIAILQGASMVRVHRVAAACKAAAIADAVLAAQ